MKTQYKPIAMRCTQEQFDSIKDRIPLPIISLCDFKKFQYLTNNNGGGKSVSNIKKEFLIYQRFFYEVFDGEFFLDCCGRDKDLSLSFFDEFSLWYASKKEKAVDEINFDNVIKELLKDKFWNGSDFQILIDKQWLNLFGFIKEADDFYRLNNSDLIEVLINDSGVKVYTQSVFLNHIVYVHQLQNLHQALTGIELKTDENK